MKVKKIIEWSKTHFKNIFEASVKIEEALIELSEEVIRDGMNNNKYMREKDLLKEYEDILINMRQH